jgi:predicted permease
MEGFLRECRYGVRTFRKSPGFAAVAIATLALGIGAATAIFSVVDAVLLRPLPYPNPRELVRIWERAADGHRMNLADPNFDDFHAQNETLSEMAIYGYGTTAVSGGREPVRVDIAEVSRGFFPVLGVAPSLGRGFAPDEQRLHGTPAAIVSHDYWQKYLDGAADLSGRRLAMEGSVYQVVGVMPKGFDFPQGVAAWIPRELEPELPSRTAHNWRAIGRLRPGVGLAAARANLNAIGERVKRQYDKDVDLVGAVVVSLQDALVGDVRTGLLTLSGAVALLLLVAGANVAGLLLARTSSRRKELAVRAALGANRGRLMQQFLGESVALTGAGGALGILLAAAAVRALPSILPANLPRQQGIAVNLPVLVFALAASVAVALSLALVAAWRAGGGDLQAALASGSRGDSGGGSSQRLRAVLVSGEIALTLVILVGAGLLGRSFLALVSTSPGFRSDRLVTVEFASPRPSETGLTPAIPTLGASPAVVRQIELVDRLAARLRALPGAEGVALAGALPAAGGDNLVDGSFLVLDGRASPKDFDEWGLMARDRAATGKASYAVAGPDYFRTLGIPLVRGRFFESGDEANAPHVAVISETLARERWPGQDPIGHVINFGNMDGDLRPLTIVGVAGDVRAAGLDRPPAPVVYVSYRQRGIRPDATPTFLVRTATPPGAMASSVRGVFRELAPDLPVRVSTFDAELGGWLADRRFLLLLVGVFAASALLLAAVGIYGIVAFSVARRTREIGIRMALGAERRDVLRMVIGEGAGLALAGIAAGVVVSLAVTRLVASLLFGVGAADPVTFGAVSILLAGAALAASYLPARRAMRLDPNAALRVD